MLLSRRRINQHELLEKAENLKGEDELEILDQPPLRMVVPIVPPDKGKRIATMSSKRKLGGSSPGTEKVMYNALKTRSSKKIAKAEANIPKEGAGKAESLISMGTGRVFSLDGT